MYFRSWPARARFHYSPPPYQPQLEELFGGQLAAGKHALQPDSLHFLLEKSDSFESTDEYDIEDKEEGVVEVNQEVNEVEPQQSSSENEATMSDALSQPVPAGF